jgi:hypothetical protein
LGWFKRGRVLENKGMGEEDETWEFLEKNRKSWRYLW